MLSPSACSLGRISHLFPRRFSCGASGVSAPNVSARSVFHEAPPMQSILALSPRQRCSSWDSLVVFVDISSFLTSLHRELHGFSILDRPPTEHKYDDEEEEEDLTGSAAASSSGRMGMDDDDDIDENDSWAVIDSYFDDRGLVRQQVCVAAFVFTRAAVAGRTLTLPCNNSRWAPSA